MFLAVVAPIAAFVVASAAIAHFPELRAQVEHVGLVWTLFMVLFVGAMAYAFPRVVRWAWDTAPFPEGPQRELLDDVARRSGFQPAALRIWRTGHLVANAPYPYAPDHSEFGYGDPSGIFRHRSDGHFYMTATSRTRHEAVLPGTVLLRTDNLRGWKSWRCWNGADFTTTFVDPYAEPRPDCTRRQVSADCKPVGST